MVAFGPTAPILRIFDVDRALAFYRDWLGFAVDWRHGEGDAPRYLQVSRDGLVLHLSEHHGDCCPGATVFVTVRGLRAFHAEIIARDYPFNRPGIDCAPWGGWIMETTDPFANRLRLHEPD